MEEGCGNRVTDWVSAGQYSILRLRRDAFQPISFDLEVRGYRSAFEFWQRVIKERQEDFFHANYYFIFSA